MTHSRNSKFEIRIAEPVTPPGGFLCRFASLLLCVHLWLLFPALAQTPPPKSAPPDKAAPAKPAAKPAIARPAPAEITAPRLDLLDGIITKAIADDELPGAVVLVGWRGETIYRKAYGARAVMPAREEMTADTIFDLASLTKVIATTSCVAKLIERGRIRLNDPVVRYIPEFAGAPAPGAAPASANAPAPAPGQQTAPANPNMAGKDQVTIRHLLTHTSGLRPIPSLPAKWEGADAVLKSIYDDALAAPPGARFNYSDTGFILLGELVRRVSGLPLDEFFLRNIAQPMGLKEMRFRPPAEWRARIAPTEEIDLPAGAQPGSGRGTLLRGTVHDPRARGMGGVAGHAGLFGTADDLAIFARMLLAGGVAPNGTRIFSAETVALLTSVQTPAWVPSLRGLGWDIDSTFSAPRGELFPVGSFGHTGFTGTSIWMDPASRTFAILLGSTQHPRPRPAISSLRSRVATAVAAVGASFSSPSPSGPPTAPSRASSPPADSAIARGINSADRLPPRNAQTRTGLDVLAAQNFAALKGKRVGLITNHTGLARDGSSAIDLLKNAPGVTLVALFSPEHGIAGRMDDKVGNETDAATGLPIYSLYGETRRPTDAMLKGIDSLVFDIQDAGVRFYTYATTLGYCLEEAAKRKIVFYVLDRPNPMGGEAIEGPMLDKDRLNFVGYFPMPVRHGMTTGELARMFAGENRIKVDLHVVPMQDWQRRDRYEATGLIWTAPSPNLRSLDATLLYPGVEILQAGGVSVGRGTDTPFEQLGAPWIRGVELADYLNKRFVPGVKFVPVRFTPSSGMHKDAACEGVALIITDRASLHSMLMGLEIAAALWKLYPHNFQVDKLITLVGNATTVERIKRGDAPTRILADMDDDIAAFRRLRAKYLLY